MQNIKVKNIALFMLLFCGSTGYAETDVYNFRMNLYIPRVYDNTSSLGYRKYQKQIIKGEMLVTYLNVNDKVRPDITITNLVNLTHKISNAPLSYTTYIDDYPIPRINLIGDNMSQSFKTASVTFALVCEPSYAITPVDEDNSLYITLSGKGTVIKSKGRQKIRTMMGNVSGQQGCSCSAYGHLSPTRVNGYWGPWIDWIDDVAAAWGTWRAVYVRTRD